MIVNTVHTPLLYRKHMRSDSSNAAAKRLQLQQHFAEVASASGRFLNNTSLAALKVQDGAYTGGSSKRCCRPVSHQTIAQHGCRETSGMRHTSDRKGAHNLVSNLLISCISCRQ